MEKNRILSKVVAFALTFCMIASICTAIFTVSASEVTPDGLEYTDNGTEITITGYEGTSTAVVIPSTIDGKPVTEIGDSAFFNKTITSVVIPSSVKIIENEAFSDCSNLTSVTLTSGLGHIGVSAFFATKITAIDIPGSVTRIGNLAFGNCQDLRSVTFRHVDVSDVSMLSLQSMTLPAPVSGCFVYHSSVAKGFDTLYVRNWPKSPQPWLPDGYVDGNGDDGNDDEDENEADIGIDYSAADLIVPGSDRNFGINLTKETFIKPDDYDIKSFSTDGGVKWKAAKADTFSDAKLNKLFSKELDLRISDTAIDKSTKQPGEGAVIVTFPKINKRPKIDKLVVNYAIAADASGATPGAWVLTVKDGSSSVKNDIEVGLASGKTINNDGYGRFTGANGTKNGITILPLTGAKPAKTVYFIRNAPKQSGSVYTPASKARKINVLGEQKKPQYKINKGVIKYKANTYTQPGSSTASLKTAKGEWKTAGEVTLWMAATAKKPASAKQTLTITAPAAAP